MTDQDRARTLATAVRLSVLLRHFTETRHIYGDVPDERTALELHQLLVGRLDFTLEGVKVPLIEWKDERPHFENTGNTLGLVKLTSILFLELSGALDCGVGDLNKLKGDASKNGSP